MLNLVSGQHQSLQRFDRESEDTSPIVTRGSWYATGPHCSSTRNGPMYQGANFPLTPKRDTPLIDETFK
jgi:hypothetical protein